LLNLPGRQPPIPTDLRAFGSQPLQADVPQIVLQIDLKNDLQNDLSSIIH
jgi:hypothetical protein